MAYAQMELPAILTALGGVMVAIVAGFFQWFVNRRKTDTDANAAMISGFVGLFDENRKERAELHATIARLERQLLRCRRALAENRIALFENGDPIDEKKG